MRAAALALATIAALAVAMPVADAPAARDGGYATIVEGAYLGEGVFRGRVRTEARGALGGKSVRHRCANRRRLDTATHDGAHTVSMRTTRKGRWRFFLPEEPGRTIKVFVLAKRLPGGGYCTAGVLKIRQP